jgi:hypothetical protein
MSVSMSVNNQAAYGNQTIAENRTLTAEGQGGRSVSVPAAKAGDLTTRTDNETGTLTMDSGHGITTGAVIDLFWTNTDGSKGMRREITVGTVSSNSVPIGADNSGSGDNLPPLNTEITAMVPVEEVMPSPAANSYVFFGCSAPCPAHISVQDADSVLLTKVFPKATGGAYQWNSQNGETNPMAGETATKLKLSHGEISAQTIQVLFLFD